MRDKLLAAGNIHGIQDDIKIEISKRLSRNMFGRYNYEEIMNRIGVDDINIFAEAFFLLDARYRDILVRRLFVKEGQRRVETLKAIADDLKVDSSYIERSFRDAIYAIKSYVVKGKRDTSIIEKLNQKTQTQSTKEYNIATINDFLDTLVQNDSPSEVQNVIIKLRQYYNFRVAQGKKAEHLEVLTHEELRILYALLVESITEDNLHSCLPFLFIAWEVVTRNVLQKNRSSISAVIIAANLKALFIDENAFEVDGEEEKEG